MKREFAVLKDRPKIGINLTRDSVAAADDCEAPHARRIDTRSFLDPAALLREVHPGYLPRVTGLGHSWDCYLNGRLIATVTAHEVVPRIAEVEYGAENHLHFEYRSATF